jgi:hypothetical protein
VNDKTQALLYLAAAGIIFLIGSRLLARPKVGVKVKRLACLGDSITAAGYYCSDLAGILGCESKVFGYESQGTAAVGTHVEDVIDWNPDTVVVLAGVNDLPQAGGAQKAIDGLGQIYKKLHDGGIATVIAVQITPWHGYPSAVGHEVNTDTVNTWIANEAKVEAFVKTSSLGDYSGRLKDQYDSGDGLHLNREGQAQLAVLIVDQAFGG